MKKESFLDRKNTIEITNQNLSIKNSNKESH